MAIDNRHEGKGVGMEIQRNEFSQLCCTGRLMERANSWNTVDGNIEFTSGILF